MMVVGKGEVAVGVRIGTRGCDMGRV
jgi:hypothetical protein